MLKSMTKRIAALILVLAGTAFAQSVPRFIARAIAPVPGETQRELAPGIISVLYGHNLGPETACVADAPPTELCGTQVFFGDLPAQLLYVQKNQINLRVPSQARGGAHSAVRVVHQGQSSRAVMVWVANRIDSPPLDDAEATAEALLSRWEAAEADLAYNDWKSNHPNAMCRESREISDGLRALDQWCYRCASGEGLLGFEWSFYIFEPSDAPACRLQQFHSRLKDASETSLEEVYRDVSARLTHRYGPADEPGRVHAQGSAFWRQTLRWHSDWGEIYLYLSKPLFKPLHLGLLARGKDLLAAMAEDEALLPVHWGTKALGESEVGRDLADALDTRANCYAGPEPYQKVITAGERFLTDHPDSPHRLDVLFLLAQAHETQWSFTSADQARLKAIDRYGQVAAAEPNTPRAAYANRRLPRLKLGLNTTQRRFFCSGH